MKTISLKKTILLFSLGILFFVQCSKTTSKIPLINPPFKNAKVKYHEFDVDVSKGDQLKLPKGTVISIPENAFVDKDGKPVAGKVKVFYREFHTLGDIISSGIPMEYDTAGIKVNFSSAGMFQIYGYQNDAPVFIAKDKKVKIDMASYQGGNYGFYNLDTVSGAWKYEGQSAPVANKEKQEKLKLIKDPGKMPVSPQQYVKDRPVFDIELDQSSFPELKELKGVLWQYAGTSDAQDLAKKSWVFDQDWTKAGITGFDTANLTYSLQLQNDSVKFNTTIRPVLKGKNFEKAIRKFKEKMDNYNKALTARINAENEAKQMADVMRSFSINNFGVYNWDRFYKYNDVVRANLKIEPLGYENSKVKHLYQISTEQNYAVQYHPNGNNFPFAFREAENNKLIILFDNGKIGKVTGKQFKEASQSKAEEVYITVSPVTAPVETPEDIDAIIRSL